MRVLLLGSGAREHAIGWKLGKSPDLERLISAPGNPGLSALGPAIPTLDPGDFAAVADLAIDREVDLVVVGPEAPLAAGIVDALTDKGIPAFGPSRSAARLEASKAYAKQIMARAGVATAAAAVFTDEAAALDHLERDEGPYVVKADGLAAGKGVLVSDDTREAAAWVRRCFEGEFGSAGATVVIEDFLRGPELSVIAICDGERALVLPEARDHKRLGDGDRGPNTGGMGSYSPVAMPAGFIDSVVSDIIDPVLDALAEEGVLYRGFLFAGLVQTDDGPKVLEFNCRLGDPEAQVILPRLDEDLLRLLAAAAAGDLPDRPLRFHDNFAVDVVLASSGYPESARSGDPIQGVERASATDGVHVFHAGTAPGPGGLATAGGRVLNVVGVGPDLATARERAYAAAHEIEYRGKQLRRDIGPWQ